MQFTHLHVHSQYSVLDGMSKIADLVDKCLRTGMMSIALTDHGNMFGIKEFLDYCKKVNSKRKEAWEAEQADKPEDQRTPFVPFTPIVGCEAYCARRGRHSMTNEEAFNGEGRKYIIDRSGWHLILLAKNQVGYHNLCRLISLGFMDDAFNYTSRIDKEILAEYHEGIICSSACLGGELPQKIMSGDIAAAEETIEWFKSIFGDDYYIELQRHQTDKPASDQNVFQRQQQVNPILIDLARKHGVKLICTNDVHFVEEEHAEAHDRLICLSTNHNVQDVDRMHYTKQEWLKTPEEMAAIFADIPEALSNTQEIVDKVEIYDIDHGPIMPKFPIPEDFGTEESYRERFTDKDLYDEFMHNEHGKDPLSKKDAEKRLKNLGGYERMYRIKLEADYLAYLTWQGARTRYPELADKIDGQTDLSYHYWDNIELDEKQRETVDRILFELNVMKTMGFPGYFLIVMDFIRAAREELDVSVGPGRGSAAGSVVAYCLRITDLDPLAYDLLFERFLNPDRISLPDIDTDFEDSGRPKVLDWVSEKYGRTHVAHIITYGAMASKSAIADIGRVQGVPLPQVNAIKALIPDAFPDNIKDEKGKSPKVNLKNCYKYVSELQNMLHGDDPEICSMLHYAQQLEGTVRQVGIHACGVIIGADDLTKFAPLSSVNDPKENKRVLVTQYDGHVVESVGLIKMDFLGLKTLTIIKECLRNVKKARGIDVDIDHISKEDPETYKLFQEGRTVAVFQFESPGMQKYLRELKPTVIGDLIAMNALYRPGPMEYIPSFIRRKHGEEEITYDIPIMEKYLKDTYGVTVYQEQVMLLSRLLADFTRGESDKLRKAMGKKQMAILQELKGKFMAGGKKNNHDEKVLEKIWKDWEAFASYAFNKSHAACYGWVAYQTGYLKAHYPAEFMAANLTDAKDDITEVTKLMDECRAMQINVLEPDVNESELNFTVNSKGDIRFGLGGVKGVGEAAVEAIIREREKNGKYTSIYDFLERVNLQACNRKTVESLALAGAFDCFEDIYREQLISPDAKGEIALEVLMRYGNKYQQDKQSQTNSLFGDLADGGVEITKPILPKVPRMTTIEKLNIEKSLIGIFLSAHPLDEFEFEVKELCDITAEQLRWLDSMRTPDARRAAKNIAPNDDNGEDTNKEEAKTVVDPTEFIQQNQNRIMRAGGLITQAEEAVSQKGNPYGRYVIEDYTGSHKLVLFGETYKKFAPVLKPNVYVLLDGMISQRGSHGKWFKPKPIDEAEYEFDIQQVNLLKDAQQHIMKSLTLQIPIEAVQPDIINEIVDQCQKNPGNARLQIMVFDSIRQNVVTFNSLAYTIHVSSEFYHWLKDIENRHNIIFQINE